MRYQRRGGKKGNTRWALYVSRMPNAGPGRKTARGRDQCMTQNWKLNMREREKLWHFPFGAFLITKRSPAMREKRGGLSLLPTFLCQPPSVTKARLSTENKEGKRRTWVQFWPRHVTGMLCKMLQRINRMASSWVS